MPLLDQRGRKPFLSSLMRRPTLILKQPVIRRMGLNLGGLRGQITLPPGVTEEQAVKVIQETWGKKLAAGLADRAGLTGPARDQFIENWSRVVSEGLLKGA